MNYLDAVLLGVVEGLTEFLPISSTGHLNIASKLLGLQDDASILSVLGTSTVGLMGAPLANGPFLAASALFPGRTASFMKTFKVVIQFGAILAVLVLYWRALLVNWRVMLRVAIAFVPAAVVGFLFYSRVREVLENVHVTLWALVIGGNVLVLFEVFHGERADAVEGLEKMTLVQALLIGVGQTIALIPGVSRSAATVLGGLAVGLKRRTVVEFSFLLAVPTMAAASAYSLYKERPEGLNMQEGIWLSIGLVVSFVVALGVVRWLLRFVQTHTFIWFGIYRIIAAGVFWWLLFGR